jgi:hypothetical protein
MANSLRQVSTDRSVQIVKTSNKVIDKTGNKTSAYPTPDGASNRQASVSNASPPGNLIQMENGAATHIENDQQQSAAIGSNGEHAQCPGAVNAPKRYSAPI